MILTFENKKTSRKTRGNRRKKVVGIKAYRIEDRLKR